MKSWEGQRLLDEEENEAAVAVLTEAILLTPDIYTAYRIRAVALTRLGRHEEAKTDMDHVARLGHTFDEIVGPERYVFSFFLAGLIGLAVQYRLRRRGWLGVGYNAVIGSVELTVGVLWAINGWHSIQGLVFIIAFALASWSIAAWMADRDDSGQAVE